MNPVAWFDALSGFVTSVIFFSVTLGGVEIPLIVVWLIVAGGFFTVYLGFQNIRGFKHAIQLVSGKYDNDPDEAGEVSHFQALATAVSGTVGLGNIAGVAVAIALGGPGATFWMIVAGFLGMSTKMAECTLGVKFRRQHSDGTVSGGPMYYLRDAVGKVTNMRFGKFLAGFFAVCTVGGSLGGGNMFQSNQASQQIINVTGGTETFLGRNPWVIGLIFAILVAVVIIGGIKSIARVTEKIVPGMAIIYVAACLFVLIVNFGAIPNAMVQIFSGAFSPEGITGGVVGVLLVGFQRAAFSNEAGVGSASIAHSAVRTDEPATEGYVALLEPFIDTIVICTMTALTIVITGAWARPDATELGGVQLTSTAFESVISWFPVVLAISVIFFAFSTMISWSYYGMKAIGYLFGDSQKAENVFKGVFCVFTVIGSAASLSSVIDFSDSAIFAMSLPNIVGLYILARVLRKEIFGYRDRVKSGEIVASK
ncbi:MAG: alanine:cation symporter family protein [Microlunatus sp.]|nr:alanine:cation symporter family protein [Microlunatus sp.]